MPELPEVETIAAALRTGNGSQPPLVGRRIESAQVIWPRSLAVPGISEFQARIQGQEICAIGRRGKFLVFSLPVDSLLIHLRMSGDLLVEPQAAPIPSHHRLLVLLEGGLRLAFHDPRKFGRAWLLANPQQVLGRLGPEPLEAAFTASLLYDRLKARRRQLKPLLLDQAFLAGLGNIYTDEALHRAQLHPMSLSNEMTRLQAEHLWESIRAVLQEGIRRNGASIDWVYRGGDFQNYFRVYQRAGQSCPVCGTTIQRLVVGQRGTHYCPVCQQM